MWDKGRDIESAALFLKSSLKPLLGKASLKLRSEDGQTWALLFVLHSEMMHSSDFISDTCSRRASLKGGMGFHGFLNMFQLESGII